MNTHSRLSMDSMYSECNHGAKLFTRRILTTTRVQGSLVMGPWIDSVGGGAQGSGLKPHRHGVLVGISEQGALTPTSVFITNKRVF